MRKIKFRIWNGFEMMYDYPVSLISSAPINSFFEGKDDIMQFTGLLDKNGKEIYEGDIIRIRTPYRSTQTHTGDNIPNGSYTEPMEPEIRTEEEDVVFENGTFGIKSERNGYDLTPLMWVGGEYEEDDLKMSISFPLRNGDIFDDPEEGDLGYLLEKYKLKDLNELLKYVSGIEVIGNIYQNPDLLK